MSELLSQEPSLFVVWLLYGAAGIASFFLCRLRHWAVFVVLPCVLLLCLPILMELYDPQVGPALWREAKWYVVECHAALLVALLGPYLGARFRAFPSGRKESL